MADENIVIKIEANDSASPVLDNVQEKVKDTGETVDENLKSRNDAVITEETAQRIVQSLEQIAASSQTAADGSNNAATTAVRGWNTWIEAFALIKENAISMGLTLVGVFSTIAAGITNPTAALQAFKTVTLFVTSLMQNLSYSIAKIGWGILGADINLAREGLEKLSTGISLIIKSFMGLATYVSASFTAVLIKSIELIKNNIFGLTEFLVKIPRLFMVALGNALDNTTIVNFARTWQARIEYPILNSLTKISLALDNLPSTLSSGLSRLSPAFTSIVESVTKATSSIGRFIAESIGIKTVASAFANLNIGLMIADFGTASLKAADHVKELVFSLGNLNTNFLKMSDNIKPVNDVKAKFELIKTASFELGQSIETVTSVFKKFYDSVGTSLSLKDATSTIVNFEKTLQNLRTTEQESAAAHEALNNAFVDGTTNITQLAQIFGSSLYPALDQVSKQTGVTTDELIKLIEQGKITSEEVIPSLATAAANSTASIQSLAGATQFSAEEFRRLSLAGKTVQDNIPGLSAALGKGEESFNKVSAASNAVSLAWLDLKTNGATIFQPLVDGANKVSQAISNWWNSSSLFDDMIAGFVEGFGGLLTKVNVVLEGVKQAFNVVGESIGTVLGSITSWDFSDLGTSLSKIFDDAANSVNGAIDKANAYYNVLDNTRGATKNFENVSKELSTTLKDLPIPKLNADLETAINAIDKTSTASEALDTLWKEISKIDPFNGKDKNTLELALAIQQITNRTNDAIGTQQAFAEKLATLPDDKLNDVYNAAIKVDNSLKAMGDNGVLLSTIMSAAFLKLNLDITDFGNGVSNSGRVAIAAFDLIAKNAESTSIQIRSSFEKAIDSVKTQADLDKLTASLISAYAAGKVSADEYAAEMSKVSFKHKELADQVDLNKLAFKQLGLDYKEVAGGITNDGQRIIDSFKAIAADSTLSSKVISIAFSEAISSAKTKAEIEELKISLASAFTAGRISLEQYNQGLSDFNDKLQAISETVPGVEKDLQTLGVESAANLKLNAEKMKLAFEDLQAAGTASTKNIRDSFVNLATAEVDAALAAGKSIPEYIKQQAAALGLSNTIDQLIEDKIREQKETEILSGLVGQSIRLSQQKIDSTIGVAEATKANIQASLGLAEASHNEYAARRLTVELAQQESTLANLAAARKNIEARAATEVYIALMKEAQQRMLLGDTLSDEERRRIQLAQVAMQTAAIQAQAAGLVAEAEAKKAAAVQLGDLANTSNTNTTNKNTQANNQNAESNQQNTQATNQNAQATEQHTNATDKGNKTKSTSIDLLKNLNQFLGDTRKQMLALSETSLDYFNLRLAKSLGENGVRGAFDEAHKAQVKFNNSLEEGNKDVAKYRNEIAEAGQVIKLMDEKLIHAFNGFQVWEQSIKKAAAETKKLFYEQKLSVEELNDSIDSMTKNGSLNMRALDNATRLANNSFSLLGEKDLSTLRSSIEDAKNKLKALQEEAISAQDRIAELNSEIAAEKGNTDLADQLDLELKKKQAIAEVEKKLAEARLTNDKTLINSYETQLAKLKELYDIKESNLQQDIRKRKQEEIDKKNNANEDDERTDKALKNANKINEAWKQTGETIQGAQNALVGFSNVQINKTLSQADALVQSLKNAKSAMS